MSKDVEVEDRSETIEMIVDSGCRRIIARPKAFKGMEMEKTENVGTHFRAEEEKMATAKTSREHATFAVTLDMVPAIVGTSARAKETKKEHT